MRFSFERRTAIAWEPRRFDYSAAWDGGDPREEKNSRKRPESGKAARRAAHPDDRLCERQVHQGAAKKSAEKVYFALVGRRYIVENPHLPGGSSARGSTTEKRSGLSRSFGQIAISSQVNLLSSLQIVSGSMAEPTLKKGWLKKLSRSGLVKNWQKRFFVLSKGRIYYYTKSTESFPYGEDLKVGTPSFRWSPCPVHHPLLSRSLLCQNCLGMRACLCARFPEFSIRSFPCLIPAGFAGRPSSAGCDCHG